MAGLALALTRRDAWILGGMRIFLWSIVIQVPEVGVGPCEAKLASAHPNPSPEDCMTPLLLAALAGPALAADHADSPAAAADPAADIGDFYAWHTADGSIVSIITFSPLTAAGGSALYDADVLYSMHVDVDADGAADAWLNVRFGQNSAGDWGVQAEVPGVSDPVSGPVGEVIEQDGVKLYAGLTDDPFFFDLQGFNDTLATGTIAFDSTRDSIAGLNVTAVVVEFDAAAAVGSATQIQTWATTARK